jgi:alkylhydroperoxidase/carboxymuconolactone decarboxylase family protein YurZ
VDDYKECLRRLAVRDDALIASMLANEPSRDEWGLDARSRALVRVSATVAVGSGQASYQHVVERALAAGATPDQIVGTLVAVMSLTGVPRAITGASKLALALGYDVDAALEGFDV